MFTAGTRKIVPTLRGVFGGEKPKVERDFVQENRANLRELERATAEKAQQKIDAAQRQWQPASRAVTSQTRLSTKTKVQAKPGATLKNPPKTAAPPPDRESVNSKPPLQGLSECPSCGAVRQPQITRAVQTENIQDKEYLHDALKKCSSELPGVEYSNRGAQRSCGGYDAKLDGANFDANEGYQKKDDIQEDNYQYHKHDQDNVVCCTDEEDNHSAITVLYNNRNRKGSDSYRGDDNEGMKLDIGNLSLGKHSEQRQMPGSPSNRSVHTLRSKHSEHSQQLRADASEQPQPPRASSMRLSQYSVRSQQKCNQEPGSPGARSRQTVHSQQSKLSQHSRHHYRQPEHEFLQQQQFESTDKKCQGSMNQVGGRGDWERGMRKNEQQVKQQATQEDPNCPYGHYLLSEPDRLNALRSAEVRFKALVSELSQMPITSDTLRLRTRKQEIEDELKDIEENIRIFSKPKVYIKRDN